MTHLQIELDGIPIEILRKPIKNIHLRIYPPDGRVRVSAPIALSLNHIYKQIEAKLVWLHTQRARIQALPPRIEPSLQNGDQQYFLGTPYTLKLIEHPSEKVVKLHNNIIQLHMSPNASTTQKTLLLNRWYQMQMQSLVPDLIKKWQPIMAVNVANWGTKIMKTRWGSCNIRTKHIWLNLVLIKKPIECLEYVLVHEMVHLLEASHNKRFHQLMDHFMPEWQTHKKTLNSPTS